MIVVTAAIALESPNRLSQVCAARAIGSKGKSSGLGTHPSYRGPPAHGTVRAVRGRVTARGIRIGSAGAYMDMANYRSLHCLQGNVC